MDQLRSPGVRRGRWNGQNIQLLQIQLSDLLWCENHNSTHAERDFLTAVNQ